MRHGLFSLDLAVVNPQAWDTLPSADHIKSEVARVLLANRDVLDTDTGVDAKRVRKVVLTGAAWDQISCMWHGHRAKSALGPPQIPLKYFVCGYGQDGKGDSWVDIEVHPGVDEWEALESHERDA
jgi:hypothetical protein